MKSWPAFLTRVVVMSTLLSFGASVAGANDELEELVVTATRYESNVNRVPYRLSTVTDEHVKEYGYRTLPQALRDIPGVLVQETSAGQGSPYIRGFTGFRNVLLMDGVRLNNSAYRDGPNQYWATLDVFSVDRLEVVKGTLSALYGSDAIGGTVNVVSRTPEQDGAGLLVRSASAEESTVVHGYADLVGEAGTVSVEVTGKTFGDVDGGGNVGLQTNVGYDEEDFQLRLSRELTSTSRLTLLHQQVSQDDVPRTHRTVNGIAWRGTTVGTDLRRDLDQDRSLSYARFDVTPRTDSIDRLELTASFQQSRERRDRVRGDGRSDAQGFSVNTLGFDVEILSSTRLGRLLYGIDVYRDSVDSFSTRNPIQGPVADDATYMLAGAYLQGEIRLSDSAGLLIGVRSSMAKVDASRVFDPKTGGMMIVDDSWRKTVFNVRGRYDIADNASVFIAHSRGFRAPNLSDLTRFDSARTNEFETPSPSLAPETFSTIECGLDLRLARGTMKFSAFRVRLQDLIVRVPTGNVIGGEFEVTKRNSAGGFSRGLELEGRQPVGQHVILDYGLAWLDGEKDTFPASEPVIVTEPLDRLMPLTSHVGLEYRPSWLSRLEMRAQLVHVRRQDDLSTRDALDTSRIPPGGTPGFTILNLGAEYRVDEHLRFDLLLDNVTDRAYRIHGSGSNQPGRNLIVSVQLSI